MSNLKQTNWMTSFSVEEIDELLTWKEHLNRNEEREKMEAVIPRFSKALFLDALDKQDEGLHSPDAIFQYWNSEQPPADVAECINSWRTSGINTELFNEDTASEYLSKFFDKSVVECFEYCHHPAMQSDYFRLARLYNEGGLYMDADDRLTSHDGDFDFSFSHDVVVMPLARSPSRGMMAVREAIIQDGPHNPMYFYFNNAPVFSVKCTPIIELAFKRATIRILDKMHVNKKVNIHRDTGPTNFSIAIMEYALNCYQDGKELNMGIKFNWNWMSPFEQLSYKATDLNWRKNAVIVGKLANQAKDRKNT